jgi:amidase
MMNFADYSSYDALALGDLVRRGEILTRELVDTALGAIETFNPQLDAVVRIIPDAVENTSHRAMTDAPFGGVPFLLKDTGVSLAGVPTEYGSRYFKGYARAYDSEIVRRYKQAGFIIIGKANCSELGTSCSAINLANGNCSPPAAL